MAAKKKAPEKKTAPKKRIKPVVEEVVEEVIEEPQVESTTLDEEANTEASEETTEEVVEEVPEVEEEIVEEVVEDDSTDAGTSTASMEPTVEGKTSIEPDFGNVNEVPDTVETSPSDTQMVEELEDGKESVDQPSEQKKESSESSDTQEVKKSEDSSKMSLKTIILITIISALVAAFVSGGVYVYLTGVNNRKDMTADTVDSTATDTAQATDAPTATPEPSPTVDITELTVQVLNGSGQIGAAGKGADIVEGAGFVVDDTGNADNYDFEETVVQAKSEVPQSVVDDLVKALEEEYKVKTGDLLSSSSEFDIIVTVGSK